MASLPPIVVMNVNKVNNFDDIRKRFPLFSKIPSRNTFISSSTSSIPYYERMVISNDLPDEEFKETIDSSKLSYKDNSQERNHISMATDLVSSQGSQHILNETLALDTCNISCVDNANVINI